MKTLDTVLNKTSGDLSAPLHDNDRLAPIENGVHLPLVLRQCLEFDGGC
jgi:hypothetical protein